MEKIPGTEKRTERGRKGGGINHEINQNTFLLLVTILLFFVMYAIGCVLFNAQGFAKTQNFLNLFISNAGLIVIGIGMTIVMITGGIDISVGSFVAMGCMMLAWMMEKGGIGAVPAVLIVLVTGIVFGLVQGFLVAYMDIQPFIVTLAGMFFARGMTAIISKDMISITNETFMAWAKMKLYIPFGGYLNKKGMMIYPYIYPTVVIALVLLVLAFIMLKYTKFGRSIYAIGGNEQSAEVSGVNTKKTKIIIYMTAAALYALGGFLVGAKSGGSSVNMGYGWELEAIAACTIGGVSVNGGIGRISGVLIGVLVFEILKTCLQYLGVDTNYQYIAQGIVIVVAIALDIRKYIAKK